MRPVGVINMDCCPQVLCSPITAEEAQDAAAALKVIADPARLQLLSLLATAETGEACVCDLTEPLAVGQPTVSHHLRVLAEAGLVEREQRGRWAFYRLVPERLALVRHVLSS
jgi:ArsR family transcriptional regulator